MENYLLSEGIELLGFYPGYGSIMGPGDGAFANMIVKSEKYRHAETLAKLLMTEKFEGESAFEVTFVGYLDPDLACNLAK